MGSVLISFYQNKVKKSWKIAFLSAFIFGLLVHLYKFTNNFPFFDSYYNYYSSQDMLASGRWLLSAACALSSFFDLPWLIGIISVVFMACTAIVITDVFEIENPCLIIVSSGILVSFPAVTETMFFEYTADGYMLAMLLSALAVYFSRIEHCGSWKHYILSTVLLCLSCGIYQTYVSFAFILAVCYFVGKLLDNPHSSKRYQKWVVFQAAIFVSALLLYYLIWQVRMKMSGITAGTYQGMSNLGVLSAETILSGIQKSIASFTMFLLERNPLHQGFTVYSALNLITVIAFGAICALVFVRSKIYKKPVAFLIILLCIAVIPFGCYICYFVTPGITYYTRMLQSIAILFIFTGVLYERWIKNKLRDCVLLLLICVFINNTVMANVCYTYMDRSYERAHATMTEMVARIHMEDNGEAKYIAILGSFDPLEEDADIDNAQLGTLGPLKLVSKADLFYHDHIRLFLSQYTDFTLSYYRITGEEFPQQEIEPGAPVPVGYEFRFPALDVEATYVLRGFPEVAEMGIWPSKDSVKLIGDTIVVKLSEE